MRAVILLLLIAAAVHCAPFPTAYLPSDPVSIARPIRVKVFGAFNESSALMIGPGMCNQTITNIARWTYHDDPMSWSTSLIPYRAVENATLCYSSDGGGFFTNLWPQRRYYSEFRIWDKVPTAYPVPQTVTVGDTFRAFVTPPLGASAVAVLVTNHTSCFGPTPQGVIAGGTLRAGTVNGSWFEFQPTRPWATVYLCIATTSPFNTWSIVPFDAQHEMVHVDEQGFIATGRVLANGGAVTVYPAAVRFRKANVSCSPIIAGEHVECSIQVLNDTALPISPTTLQIAFLADGGFVAECPLPSLRQVSTTMLAFRFIPQRAGRAGALKLTFRGTPLVILDWQNLTAAYYRYVELVNVAINSSTTTTGTVTALRTFEIYSQDMAVMRFAVQPSVEQRQFYDSANLLPLTGFTGAGLWSTVYGVYQFKGRLNGTRDGELPAFAPLAATVAANSTVSQTITVPANAERCRLVLKYYYAPKQTDRTKPVTIGSAKLVTVAKTTNADVETAELFTLQSYLRQVLVTSSTTSSRRGGSLDGEIFAVEQLVTEQSIPANIGKLRVELFVENRFNPQLYFLSPQLTCATNASTARTDLRDIAALQRIYTTVGKASRLTSWYDATNKVFKGDPCTNAWEGVVCRNMRVVALHLNGVALAGIFPPVKELTRLTVLEARRNALTGNLLVNNSRLRTVDVSNNFITSIIVSSGTFTYANHQCLQRLVVASNALTSFPTAVTTVKSLQQLDLSRNRMAGTVPDFTASGLSLYELSLSSNFLVGTLPQVNIFPLQTLDLGYNRINGTIPDSYGKLQNLVYLDVSKNALTGTIPHKLGEIRTADQLVLRAEDNFLTGKVPYFNIRSLDVRRNFFSCPLYRPETVHGFSFGSEIVSWIGLECDFDSAPAGF